MSMGWHLVLIDANVMSWMSKREKNYDKIKMAETFDILLLLLHTTII
jgi:hypothetical protein